jgi:uncharacterized membrane protein YbhN (UPF0104 family)
MTALVDTTLAQPLDTGLPSMRQVARRLAWLTVVVAAGAFLITALPGLEALPEHLKGADPAWMAVALVFEVASTISFAAAFHGAYDRRASRRASTSVAFAVQGMNIVLPAGGTGGMAVGAVILDRAGVPRPFVASRTVALFLITSLVSFAAIAAAGFGVAARVLPGNATVLAALAPAVGAVLIVAAVVALPRAIPERPGGAEPRGRVRRALRHARVYLRDGVAESIELLRQRDGLVVWGSIGYFAFDVAALAVSFHALGFAGLPIGTLVLAYTLGHAGAIVPLPGSAEGGLIGMLVLFGTALPAATAAVIAYRVVHAGVPTVLGLIGIAHTRQMLRPDAAAPLVPARA